MHVSLRQIRFIIKKILREVAKIITTKLLAKGNTKNLASETVTVYSFKSVQYTVRPIGGLKASFLVKEKDCFVPHSE